MAIHSGLREAELEYLNAEYERRISASDGLLNIGNEMANITDDAELIAALLNKWQLAEEIRIVR